MNVIRLSDSLKVPGAYEPKFGPEPRFESDYQILSNVKVENTFQTPTLKTNRKKIDSNQLIIQSKISSISKSFESNKSKILNRVIQSKKLTQKINKSNTHQNSEKKRKANQLNKMLLFTPSQNRQNAIVTMHRAKSVMKKTYALIQNLNMIKIIDQIDQIINAKIEIDKINSNFELFNIQKKLNQILTKIETTSIKFSKTENSKSTSNSNITNNKNQQKKSSQMSKSTTVKFANTVITIKNLINVVATIKNPINVVATIKIPAVDVASIKIPTVVMITKVNIANSAWTQVVSKNMIKKFKKFKKMNRSKSFKTSKSTNEKIDK